MKSFSVPHIVIWLIAIIYYYYYSLLLLLFWLALPQYLVLLFFALYMDFICILLRITLLWFCCLFNEIQRFLKTRLHKILEVWKHIYEIFFFIRYNFEFPCFDYRIYFLLYTHTSMYKNVCEFMCVCIFFFQIWMTKPLIF